MKAPSCELEYIIQNLPETPPEDIARHVFEEYPDELGNEAVIYKRVSAEITPEMKDIMYPEDWEEFDRNTKKHWGAECRCTACGETFIAGYDMNGIILKGDYDTLECGYASADERDANLIEADSIFQTPCCWANARLVRNCETDNIEHSLMVTSPIIVGSYGGVITWMFRRWLFKDTFYMTAEPLEAQIIVGKECVKFIHYASEYYDDGPPICREHAKWSVAQGMDAQFDITQTKYFSYEAIEGNKFGAVVWPTFTDFTGTSAEKTGLEAWLDAGCLWPEMYLKVWERHPNIENLVKSGFYALLDDAISENLYRAAEYDLDPVRIVDLSDFIRWEYNRPHNMLGLRKSDMSLECVRMWSHETFQNFQNYTDAIPATAAQWNEWKGIYGDVLRRFVVQVENGEYEGMELENVTRYLRKQENKYGLRVISGAELLLDYRKMINDISETALTAAELWPHDLKAAHDRASAAYTKMKKDTFAKKFLQVHDKHLALEWTDGNFCIVIPQSNAELIEEGRILNHCVGTYGAAHCSGEMIFFVRHYRRPERSYFTLNINMKGKEPSEIQLHGYGNESKGSKKWGIPREVRAFVDRWEKEVLMPWFMKNRKKEIAA